ncbi:hypothetical protein IWX90DRAFT_157565 [Phyllosticta citrichinensis]|uniref:Uncharacterized protein n=1 Tax=Phyllosticta citrichinensis TaxID=1130410 RepID=A0ABR1Y031_9PEZI
MTSTLSSSLSYDIKTGAWTNWEDGTVMGKTITLTRRDGDVLIAFLALFTTLIGTSWWRIACYFLHYFLSSEAPRDALYHQRQAILRNSANGTSGLSSLVHALWSWRRIAKRPYYRTLPIILFGIISLGGFAVAGIFSSRISTLTGDAVMIKSTNCGIVSDVNATTQELATKILPYVARRYKTFANYGQECYTDSTNNTGSGECHSFATRQLSATITRNATCPFNSTLCKTQDQSLRFDTGYLDSRADLGINTPDKNRFLYRRITHCAPISAAGKESNYSDSGLSSNYSRYYFGPTYKGDPYTYQYPKTDMEQFRLLNFTSARGDYSLRTIPSFTVNGSAVVGSFFFPIPELARTDADVSLFFLSANDVLFTDGTDDPWYSARAEAYRARDVTTGQYIDTYVQDTAASALGCAEQEQYCNPNVAESSPERCSRWGGGKEASMLAASVFGGNAEALSQVDWATNVVSLNNYPLSAIIESLGIAALTSRDSLYDGVQGALPDNIWQSDVEYWYSAALATIQGTFVDVASGPADADIDPFLMRPDTDAIKQLCNNQIVLSTNYTNFNVFGLAVLLSVGGLIILLSYTLEPIVSYVQRRRNLDVYARLEWCANGTLQLQRLAHEALGAGTWSDAAEAVPVTAKGDRLAMLDVSDTLHPRLQAPPPELEKTMAMRPSSEDARKSLHRVDEREVAGTETSGTISPLSTRRSLSIDPERRQ